MLAAQNDGTSSRNSRQRMRFRLNSDVNADAPAGSLVSDGGGRGVARCAVARTFRYLLRIIVPSKKKRGKGSPPAAGMAGGIVAEDVMKIWAEW